MFRKINKLWQVMGSCFIAPILITLFIIQYFTYENLNIYQWLLWIHLPIIMFHEFEEYVLPGGFKKFLNTESPLAPKVIKEDTPLNEPYIFFVNIVCCWTWAIIGAILATSYPWVGFGLIIFQFLINNIQHTVIFQSKHEGYNPGLITAMFLLIPYCTFVTWYVISHNILSGSDWILSIMLALGVMLTLLSITMLRNKLSRNNS